MEAMVREGGLGPSNHSLVTGAGSHTLPPEKQIELIIIIITNSTTHIFRTELEFARGAGLSRDIETICSSTI